VVLLLEGVLVSWSLAIDEHGGHKDFRGLVRRSVITYIHERTGLYCSSLSCMCESEPYLFLALTNLREVVHARAFYSSRSGSYIETRGPTGGSDVVETLCSI
jgi:hypothetical protein